MLYCALKRVERLGDCNAKVAKCISRESLQSNRGNHLLVQLLSHRFPELCDKESLKVLWTFLALEESGQVEMLSQLKISEKDLMSQVPMDRDFPSKLGHEMKSEDRKKMLLFIVSSFL